MARLAASLLLAASAAANVAAPDTFTVTFDTDVPGATEPIVVEVTRKLAPLGADQVRRRRRRGEDGRAQAFLPDLERPLTHAQDDVLEEGRTLQRENRPVVRVDYHLGVLQEEQAQTQKGKGKSGT